MAAAAKARGNAALATGDYQGAIDAYTEAIALDPKDHVFYSNRSAAHMSAGNAGAALADGQECVKLNKAFTKGYGRVGAAQLAMGRYAESIAAYEEGLNVDPTNGPLKEGLAEARSMEAAASARARARPAAAPRSGGAGMNPFGPDMLDRLAANPKFAPLLADDAFVAKLKALQRDPQVLSGENMLSDPRMLEVFTFLLGLNMRQPGAGGPEEGGNWGEEEEEEEEDGGAAPPSFSGRSSGAPAPAPEPPAPVEEEDADPEVAAKKAAKKQAAARKEEGNRAYKAHEFAAALAAYAEATELDPEDITYRLNTAAVHYETGDFAACIDTCNKAIEHGRTVFAPFPLIGKAFARIGNAQVKQGALTEAIASYESSLAESRSEEVERKLKELKKEVKKREEQAYLSVPLGAEAKERGNEAFKAGDFPRAIAEYSEAIKRDPTNATYYTNRATARTKVMDCGAALDDCEKAIKLDPQMVRAYTRKGALQFLQQEYHKSLETYQKALSLDANNEDAREGLRKTVAKINDGGDGEGQQQRRERAMADPEVQAILSDPMVSQAIRDMQRDPAYIRTVMRDASMGPKIQKLVAAGVIGMGPSKGGDRE